jgi:hypothetical protein
MQVTNVTVRGYRTRGPGGLFRTERARLPTPTIRNTAVHQLPVCPAVPLRGAVIRGRPRAVGRAALAAGAMVSTALSASPAVASTARAALGAAAQIPGMVFVANAPKP